MLITNKKELQKFSSKHRLWQGIPGIEVSPKGRIFSVLYSGGTKEEKGNFVVLLKSEDDGKTFSEPITAVYREEGRCYDPVLWIDPLKRLWLIWAYASETEESGVFGAICSDCDADTLIWSEPFFIGHYVMMNKPTVLSTGDWLFPVAAWDPSINMLYALPPENYGHKKEETGAFVYKMLNPYRPAFKKLGGTCADKRSFDEHMVLELNNGKLMMLIRTYYGIAVSYSYNQGHTWTEPVDSKLGGPSSRFFIRRLTSGRILLINHYKFSGRNNLTALLSEDDGKTWKYSLLLDERANISYPDAVETKDGYIYITYDRERGSFQKDLDSVMHCAREILFAKITEEDILAGKLVNPNSSLKNVVSKLNEYINDSNPFKEIQRFSDVQLAQELCKNAETKAKCPSILFDYYPIACENISKLDNNKLDALFIKLEKETENDFTTILEIIRFLRSVSIQGKNNIPIVEMVEKMLSENIRENLSISNIANKLNISVYYLMHVFKKRTGITINEYKMALRIAQAKKMLKNTTKSISEIADICGFESLQYFSRTFKKAEGVVPSKYREDNSY